MTGIAVPRVALRRRLSLLALGAIAPLAMMAGIGIHALVSQQRDQAERANIDLARALSIAVEGELRVTVSALETLARAVDADHADPVGRFQQLARSTLRSRPEWHQVMLSEADGTLLATVSAAATSWPGGLQPDSLKLTLQRDDPVIGALVRSPGGVLGIPVRVPVLGHEGRDLVLTGLVKAESMLALIERQRVASNQLISIWDQARIRVARSRRNAEFAGRGPSPGLQHLLAQGGQRTEGIGLSVTYEGENVMTAYTRLQESGWLVTVAVPEADVLGGAQRSLLAYGGGVLASLVIGLMAAFAMAHRIHRPMVQLREAALALGAGAPVEPPEGDIEEIHDVSEALVAASQQQAQHRAEREKLLAQAQAAHASAEAAMHDAQGANRSKDEFLAMLGHELRNPLSPILTALQLMTRRDANVHAFERRIIERQVAHMTRLVDDLLDVSRITQGKIELRRERVDLNAVVERALEMTKPLFDTRDHPPVVDLPSEPVYAWGDWVRLAQVLSNLLSNAAKFTPPDGRVALALRSVGDTAEISVTDTGHGISADLLPQVFDLFAQGPQTANRAQGGLGLGLAIVKNLVQLHGGEVRARSEGAERGSSFIVELPVMGTMVSQGTLADAAPVEHRGSERVLIVDDNLDAADTAAWLLRDAGYTVRVAADGFAALALLDEFQPDVAVLDIGLPGMDGHELAVEIRRRMGTRQVPLIAATGYGAESDKTRALAAGFHERLVKPVDGDLLMRTIRQALAARLSAGPP